MLIRLSTIIFVYSIFLCWIFLLQINLGVLEAKEGQSSLDAWPQFWIKFLKSQKCPIILGVNKCDNAKSLFLDKPAYWSLGLGEPIPISAIHGINSGELMQKITTYLPHKSMELLIAIKLNCLEILNFLSKELI